MVAIGVIVIFLVLIAGLGIPLALRRWTLTEAKSEARLRSPETHTVTHTVSAGVDPVVEMVALRNAGFTSVVDFQDGFERIIVECDEAEREHVRAIIEGVVSPDSSTLERRVGHVSFVDDVNTP